MVMQFILLQRQVLRPNTWQIHPSRCNHRRLICTTKY